jgi:hypothetical protein
VVQGDGAGALSAYRKGLEIREALAERDPANALWQVELAVSCAKLGSLDNLLEAHDRRAYLSRGREILARQKAANKLAANQDWIGWFDDALRQLGP